jgi:plasmid stability protein
MWGAEYTPRPRSRLLWTVLLADCFHMNMKTLYIRNVPDDVAERLARMAARDGISLNAFAVKELTNVADRADNAALLDALPDLSVDLDWIVKTIHEGRDER